MNTKTHEIASKGLHSACIELLKKKCHLNVQSNILILGSGNGNGNGNFEFLLMRDLNISPANITSCDIDPGKFALSEIKCHEVDIDKGLPFKDNSFDLIICLEVIEHLENQWSLIREVVRLKNQKGFALISSPNMENFFNRFYFFVTGKMGFFSNRDYRISGHINPLFSWNFYRMLEKYGLQLVHQTSNLYFIWLIPFYVKMKIGIKNINFSQINIFLLQ